jgi:hypothetical protein
MPTIDIPIPQELPAPLPPFLTKSNCVLLFHHWNLGGKHFLSKLVAAGTLHFKPRPHMRGDVTKSEDVVKLYLSLQ